MSCPRCGFPKINNACELCGLKDLDSFELQRFKDPGTKRFEISIILENRNIFNQLLPKLSAPILYGETNSHKPNFFLFFPDENHHEAIKILALLDSKENFEILVNGRPRPYTTELWLPLISLLNGSD